MVTSTLSSSAGAAAGSASSASVVACMGASKTGQGALQALPSKSQTSKRHTIRNYALPENAIEKVISSSPRAGNSGNSGNSNTMNGSFTSRRRHSFSSNMSSANHGNSNGSSSSNSNNNKDGIAVWKVNKNGKLQSRRLTFSADRRSILVSTNRIKSIRSFFQAAVRKSNNSKNASGSSHGGGDTNTSGSSNSGLMTTKRIPIALIDRVQRGPNTARFKKALAADHGNSSGLQDLLHSEGALSIIYESLPVGGGNNNATSTSGTGMGQFESLDLAVPDPMDYEALVSCLESLVALQQEEGRYLTRPLQFLEYQWLGLGKPSPESLLDVHEWMTLVTERCELQMPKSRLQEIFVTECEKKNQQLQQSQQQQSQQQPSTYHSRHHNSSSNHSDNTTQQPNVLTLAETSLLLAKVDRMSGATSLDPIEAIWNTIIETDPVPAIQLDDSASYDSFELNVMQDAEESISIVAFLSFLRSQQREYNITIDQVTELVYALNQQESAEEIVMAAAAAAGKNNNKGSNRLLEDDDDFHNTNNRSSSSNLLLKNDNSTMAPGERLSKSRFVSFLQSDANDILDAKRCKKSDMTRPLSHYWISTSHDSYLVGGMADNFQGGPMTIPDQVDEHAYYAILSRGARCLEVAVWDGPTNAGGSSSNNGGGSGGHGSMAGERSQEPVIAPSAASASSWSSCHHLSACLKSIRYFLRQNPYSFPIILKLENHCSPPVQFAMAKQLFEILGAARLVYEPKSELRDDAFQLPSPEAARGKVIIIGKRPPQIKAGVHVMHEDYDATNDVWHMVPRSSSGSNHNNTSPNNINGSHSRSRDASVYDDDDMRAESEAEKPGVVIGFDTRGPIRANNSFAMTRSPTELLDKAEREASRAQRDAAEAKVAAVQVQEEAKEKENQAMILTQKAGISMKELMCRVMEASRPRDDSYRGEEKSTKDEGVEIHEVLEEYVEQGRSHYTMAAQEAQEAAKVAKKRLAALRHAESNLKDAEADLKAALDKDKFLEDEARKARSEAAAQQEHAHAARARLAKVRELVKANEETSTSAETVVVTALTEAKISEKRAADAEARAARALNAAEKDRARADDETSKEEELEQQVNMVIEKCSEATRITKNARERVEKAAAMLDRVKEQIKLIEHSSQYRKEMAEGGGHSGKSSSPAGRAQGGSFIAKHKAKLEEREACKLIIKEASEEHTNAEMQRKQLQKDFEEYNHVWKIQSELAAKLRKVADRSAHVADELAEHAEEEREAATLRQSARENAEANVENRGHHKESLSTQLHEAERAAKEAEEIAMQSRQRAERMAKETEKSRDQNMLHRNVQEKQRLLDEATAIYDVAVREKERIEVLVLEDKRRIELSREMKQAAERGVAEPPRVTPEELYQQEAIVIYGQAAMLRAEAEELTKVSQNAELAAETKTEIARRAREYKEKMELVVEIPPTLAKLTLLHSLRHTSWDQSLHLSNAHMHSIAYTVMERMVQSQPDYQVNCIRRFTQTKLCRVFPPWNHIRSKPFSNYDPTFPWSIGCQLVSMNMHSSDERLLVADGLFRQNGSCGYVLKPPHLLGRTALEPGVKWKFQILSGYNLPRPSRSSKKNALRPIVKVSVYQGSPGKRPVTYQTVSFKKAGPNPVFGDDAVCEVEIRTPSTAIVAFTVWDQNDSTNNSGSSSTNKQFIAGAAIPVSCLREGLRSVALFDSMHSRRGPFALASLFLQATKTT